MGESREFTPSHSIHGGISSIKVLTLENAKLHLSLVPSFGCHWIQLKVFKNDEWLDVLTPVPNVDQLPHYSTRDGSYLLAPWANRLKDAKFTFKGTEYSLRPNFPDGTAIHGDVWTRLWTVEKYNQEELRACLHSANFPDFNYPFSLKFEYSVQLFNNELVSSLYINNLDTKPVPVGMGFHPFWRRRLKDKGADVIVTVPANKIYPTKKSLPQGPAQPVHLKKDLRSGMDLTGMNVDDCYTDLTKHELSLTYNNPALRIQYRFDPIFGHVVVYSPLNEKGVSKPFVAVEPVTNVIDGFNLLEKGWPDTGVQVLEPQGRWGGSWSLSFDF